MSVAGGVLEPVGKRGVGLRVEGGWGLWLKGGVGLRVEGGWGLCVEVGVGLCIGFIVGAG